MKRKVLGIVLALVLVLSCAVTAFAYTVPSSTVVYVTPTGACYHRQSCSYIKNSYRTMSIAAAENNGYRACSRCLPDELTGKYESNWDGSGGGGGGGSGGHSGNKTPTTPAATKPGAEKGFPWALIILLGLFFGPGVLPVVWAAIEGIQYAIDTPNRRRAEEQARQDQLRAEEAKRQQFEREKAEYTALYGGKSAEEAAGMPDWAEIGPDGLPKEKGVIGYGEIFTRYVSASGKCYHSRWNCCGAMIGVHVTRAKWNGRRACSKCGGALPDLRWYTEYQKIQRIKRKYGIE